MTSLIRSVYGLILSFSLLVTAYRPVQHCKQLGDNGHYSACTSFTQYLNQTTGESDLYVRYQWYKYDSSKYGWHAWGLGEKMAGALMFIMYGDPTASNPEMTVSVRSAEGHSPPRLISEIGAFGIPEAQNRIPAVDVVSSKFAPYTGSFQHPTLNTKPSHVGTADFIVRGFAKWIGNKLSNTTTAQRMIWSSQHDQDFSGDYSVDRSIQVHQFGAGFGFVWVDLLNAETVVPMFGKIDEKAGLRGISEVDVPTAPTSAELAAGAKAVANYNKPESEQEGDQGDHGFADDDALNPFNDHGNTTPSTTPPSAQEDNVNATPEQQQTDASTTPAANKPYMIKGKTLRDWMWHMHGFFMCLAFFVMYPAGIYLLRSQKQINNGQSFNYHWTIQALATVVFAIGAFIGYTISKGISITHQYVGLLIVFLMIVQMVLGWRHHIKFLVVKRKTILSKIHVGLGRVIMPLGFVNILSGMKRREYGWFTMLLVLILIVAEVIFGAVYLRAAHVRRNKLGGGAVAEQLKAQGPGIDDDAEEYFQLGGEDDSDSDAEAEAKGASNSRAQQKREENARLAKLDRV